jgi:hypothetical protein
MKIDLWEKMTPYYFNITGWLLQTLSRSCFNFFDANMLIKDLSYYDDVYSLFAKAAILAAMILVRCTELISLRPSHRK